MSVLGVWFEREATSFLGWARAHEAEEVKEREPFSAAQYPFVSQQSPRQPYEGNQPPPLPPPASQWYDSVLPSTPPFHSSSLFPREPVAIERDDAAVYPSQTITLCSAGLRRSIDIPQPIDISPLNAENINEQLHLGSESTSYQSQNTGISICICVLARSDGRRSLDHGKGRAPLLNVYQDAATISSSPGSG